jgi:hypothetical protein
MLDSRAYTSASLPLKGREPSSFKVAIAAANLPAVFGVVLFNL